MTTAVILDTWPSVVYTFWVWLFSSAYTSCLFSASPHIIDSLFTPQGSVLGPLLFITISIVLQVTLSSTVHTVGSKANTTLPPSSLHSCLSEIKTRFTSNFLKRRILLSTCGATYYLVWSHPALSDHSVPSTSLSPLCLHHVDSATHSHLYIFSNRHYTNLFYSLQCITSLWSSLPHW